MQVAEGLGLFVNSNNKKISCDSTRSNHLHMKWQTYKISILVHIPRRQYLID